MFAPSFLAGPPSPIPPNPSTYDGVEASLYRLGIVWAGGYWWGIQTASKKFDQYDANWVPTGLQVDVTPDYSTNALVDITTDGQYLYVCGYNSNSVRVGVYDLSGNYVSDYTTGTFAISASNGIAHNSVTGHNIHLGTSGNYRITETDGTFVSSGQMDIDKSRGPSLTWDKARGCYWVTDWYYKHIYQYDSDLNLTGYHLDISAEQGNPKGVGIDSDGSSMITSGSSPQEIHKWI